jgi:hypothetical protein
MNTRSLALDVLPDAASDHEPHSGRLRFGAIVRTLAQLRRHDPRPPAGALQLPEEDAALPTRRLNRVRRLLGRLPRPGKSRNHVRRLR